MQRDDDVGQVYIEEHESAVRSMAAEAYGYPYYALRTFEEALAVPDGVVILEGDDGGQIYVVAPARHVRCSVDTLEQLLKDLDRIAWRSNRGEGAHVFYERLPVGAIVGGGMGGGIVVDGVWVHKEFRRMGLTAAIREVVQGGRPRIPGWRECTRLRFRAWLSRRRRRRTRRARPG